MFIHKQTSNYSGLRLYWKRVSFNLLIKPVISSYKIHQKIGREKSLQKTWNFPQSVLSIYINVTKWLFLNIFDYLSIKFWGSWGSSKNWQCLK